ncbi:MAG: PD-(D/E)XK nuclease family protein [Candidatus Rokuibacteriota bacterium]|nr:MAG: PD-(D/E)XK nuclease family protein [Candidatus Rokubacteria bacterium]
MIQLVESASSAERIEAARAFLAALPAGGEALVVGASRDAADDLVRRATVTRGATFGIHRASLAHLAVRIAAGELARLGAAPTSALGSEALAARVTFEALAAGTLGYFVPVARFPGFARALASTLSELRLARVAPQSLAKSPSAAHAGRDVGDLLTRFEASLRAGGLADRAALFDLAAAIVARGGPAPLIRIPIVLLDVPIASPAERAFAGALLALSPAALITVAAGDDRTLRMLQELGARCDPRETTAAPDTSALAHLRAYLFSETAPVEAARSGEAVFFSAPGEGREAVEIARRILEEARDGTPFDQMAVLLRAPQVYSTLFEAALARAGIPAFFARGARRPDPAGRALLVLLDCALEKLSARRFAEYLSLGQVPLLDDDGAPPRGPAAWVAADDEALTLRGDGSAEEGAPTAESAADDSDANPVLEGSLRAPWKWEKLLVDSAVIGGRDRWRRRMAGLAAELRLKIQELREEEPDSPRAIGIERDLANLEHLERFALPVIERLDALPVRATWGEWIAELERLTPMVLRQPERVLAVLAELRALGPIGPVALDEVRDVLAEELATVAERPPAARYGRVFVGTLEQARGHAFEVVFVPGLAERIFPQKPREDPILLDSLRRELSGELRTQGDRAQHERLLLRIAAGAAARRLYVSYSRLELAEARPRVPSFYAMEVQRALAGQIPDPQTLEREAAAIGQARLPWPAPEHARRAIDEIEHDLASLRALLGRPRADSRGRARYLLELNDCLARSLRTRWARWRPRFSSFDGIVQLAPGTRDLLLASRPTARAYSVSALQRFAACPYQFFLSAICRLAPREEIAPLERLDPLTRGSLFHEVQAECLRALQRNGQLPVVPETLGDARRALDETLDRVADKYREQLAPAIGRVWRDEIESVRVDLRTWLEKSVEGQAEWEPFAFELAFGLPVGPGVDGQSVREEVTLAGGWRLRGIIDLIERRRGAPGLRVTDHKTGLNRTAAGLVVGKGEALQPVLYGLAVERIFGQPVTDSRLSYCTRAGEFSERVVPMTEPVRRRGLEVLNLIDRAIARGFLPPAPRQKACGICDFRPVCGPVEEHRISRKDARALEDLATLRSWP